MNGQSIGLAIFGAIFLFVVIVAYILTTISVVLGSLIILFFIQSKTPLVLKNDLGSTLVYSIAWGVLASTFLLYATMLLLPIEHNSVTSRNIGRLLAEKRLFYFFVKTAMELSVTSFVTCYNIRKSQRAHKILRLAVILTLVGGIEGYARFNIGEFVGIFFSNPTSAVEAIAQGVAGAYFTLVELGVWVVGSDEAIYDLIRKKYVVDIFNSYSYMNFVTVSVWLWAIFSLIFPVKLTVYDWVSKTGVTEKTFWENLGNWLIAFASCNFVIFYTIFTFGLDPPDQGFFEGILTLICIIMFIPASIGLFAMLFFAPAILLGVSASSSSDQPT